MTTIFHYTTLLFTTLLLLLTQRVNSEPTQDKQALNSFLTQVPHAPRLKWNESDSVCTWVGVTCDSSRTHVHALRLPAVGLVGPIPENTIGRLSQLRVLSIHSNSLSGSLPSDFFNLTSLRALYIGNNRFSGEFPTELTQLTRLNRLDLSANNFSGPIPFSINNLTQLTDLFLQSNNFSGPIPSINARLTHFNASYNNFNGSIPKTLSNFPESSFTGNLQLCGGPLQPCNNTFFPPPSPSPGGAIVPSSPAEQSSKSKLSKGAIIGIVLGSVALAFALLLCLVLCFIRRRRGVSQPKSTTAVAGTASASKPGEGGAGVVEVGTSSSKDDITSGGGVERNKLVFVNGGGGNGGFSFDLEDLLRASAEVLGKGSVGTSYKAVLEEGTTVVVKRLKDVVAGKREFEGQMEVVGKCKHENLVPLRAYYFSKDEKLLVFDYLPNGSLSSLLHGSRGTGRTSLDWETRMRIALGTARGLAYLHVANNLVHANIKSTNILLRSNNEPVVSEFGLAPIFAPNAPASANRVAGYRAPEVMETRKPSFKSDVYSFGVVLLELLTGKSPNQASLGDEGVDLPRWVQSVVREEWTAEVFDVELMRYHNIEEEMVQLLQIAMACVSIVPDQRPSMPEALRMIEDMNRSGESATDDGIRQSSDDPSKGSDGQTPPPESRTPPSSVTP